MSWYSQLGLFLASFPRPNNLGTRSHGMCMRAEGYDAHAEEKRPNSDIKFWATFIGPWNGMIFQMVGGGIHQVLHSASWRITICFTWEVAGSQRGCGWCGERSLRRKRMCSTCLSVTSLGQRTGMEWRWVWPCGWSLSVLYWDLTHQDHIRMSD